MGHEDIGRVTELIQRVSANRTILMVEHNLSVVENLSDTITVLQRGTCWRKGLTKRFRTIRKCSKLMSG